MNDTKPTTDTEVASEQFFICRTIALQSDTHLQEKAAQFESLQEPMDKANAELKAKLEEIKTNWANSHAELIKNFDAAKKAFTDADQAHRRAIVALYNSQPGQEKNKSHLIPGWGVAVGEAMRFKEGASDETAIAYLVEHKFLKALRLDLKAFESLVSVTTPDFIEYVPVVIAKINPIKEAK